MRHPPAGAKSEPPAIASIIVSVGFIVWGTSLRGSSGRGT
jgi:hypothetical protein